MNPTPGQNNGPQPEAGADSKVNSLGESAKGPNTTESRSGVKSNTEFLVDLLVKVFGLITWPVLLLIVGIVFFNPIQRVAYLLPKKFELSNEIGIGGLTLKIQQQAKAAGNEELAEIISGLSKGAIEALLKIGNGSHRVTGTLTDIKRRQNYSIPEQMKYWKELEGKNLVKATEDLEVFENYFNSLANSDKLIPIESIDKSKEDRLLANSISLTENGKRAYSIVLSVVSDLIGNQSSNRN